MVIASGRLSDSSRRAGAVGWRTPLVVVVCGCLIAMISFGPRSSLGFFLTPLSQEHHWGRDVFSLALAIQNLLWGIGQPFAGGIADRFGANRVMMAGAALYALGLALMVHATTPGTLDLTAGVLIGLRPVRLLVQPRHRRLRQAAAAELAFARLRRRHRRRLVRAVPVFADRRGADGQIRLADGADDLRRRDDADLAAGDRAGDAAQQPPQRRRWRCRRNRSARPWRKPSAIAAMCCWCSASSPAASSSPSSPCICRPI